NEALQTKGDVHFADVVISPGASHAQAGNWPSIYNALQDIYPTTLNDQGGPITGDATVAFEWDPVIAAGGSFNISIDKNIYIVPEPGVASIAGAGLGWLAFRRRMESRG
ncbi:MAG: hypothetical protein U1F98_18115, partial [Verrucomicrobiota bacterium]